MGVIRDMIGPGDTPKITPTVIKDSGKKCPFCHDVIPTGEDHQHFGRSMDQPTYQGKTAAQWREMANMSSRRSQESFDNSDTDGFITQWASDTMARKYMLCAELAEQDGTWTFPALFTLTGALVPDAVWIKTKLNKWVWRIGSGATVAWFDPSRARSGQRRRANDAAKGYQVGLIRTRATVASSSSGRGLSGALSVGYYVRKVDDAPIEIIDDGKLGTQYQDD